MNKNNKITILGSIISLICFITAFFCFCFARTNYGGMFLAAGGILLTITSIYKINK